MSRGKGGKRKGKLQEGQDQQASASDQPAEAAAGDGALKVEGEVPLDTRESDGEVIDPAGVTFDALQATPWQPPTEAELAEAQAPTPDEMAEKILEPAGPTAEEVAAKAAAAAETLRLRAVADAANDAAQPVPVAVVEQAVVKAKLKPKDPDDDMLPVEEAAASMVDGFKESWLPAIRAKARSMGIEGSTTRRTWRGVFLAWGGPSILR